MSPNATGNDKKSWKDKVRTESIEIYPVQEKDVDSIVKGLLCE